MKNSILSNRLSRDEMKAVCGGTYPADCMQKCLADASSYCLANEGGGGINNGNYELCYQDLAESCVLGCIGIVGY